MQQMLDATAKRKRDTRIGCAAVLVVMLLVITIVYLLLRAPAQPITVINVQGRDLLCVRDGGLSCNWDAWNRGE